ncbi:MAG: hypothetical protein QXT26_07765 [Thermoproteota archaeon]
MRAIVILTPAESKRLIAKGVVSLPIFQRALKDGIIIIGAGTTNAYIFQELMGQVHGKEIFPCGIVTPERLCLCKEAVPYLRKYGHAPVWIFVKGKLQEEIRLDDVLDKLSSNDIFVKGANALDPQGNAAVFVGARTAGTIGKFLGVLLAVGVNIIIPVGYEKCIPVPIHEILPELGISKIDYSMGMPIGLVPLPGYVVTEKVAIEVLTGAQATPIGAGGINGAEGSIILLIKGTEEQVNKAIRLIQGLKGERDKTVPVPNCSDCITTTCPNYRHPS